MLDDEVPGEVLERVKIVAWLVGLAEHIKTGAADDPADPPAIADATRAIGLATIRHIVEQIGAGAHADIIVSVTPDGVVLAHSRPPVLQ